MYYVYCRIYDTDGSGSIDFTEFMIVFHIMSDGTPDEVNYTSSSYYMMTQ